jgi:hypothetical protein
MEMARAALRLINNGKDFPWTQADITAKPIQRSTEESTYKVTRTVYINGRFYVGRAAWREFEIQCELREYPPDWQPNSLSVNIYDTTRYFCYVDEWQEGCLRAVIRET